VAFNPVYAEGFLHLAINHAALGDYDAATAALRRALELDPALEGRARDEASLAACWASPADRPSP
jgi:cytochrome c-type biogenesis protein CcmH/NrfG